MIMNDIREEIAELIRPNLRKRICVAFYRLIVEESEAIPYIPEHLRYMKTLDDDVLMSGPLVVEGHLVGEGMTLFHSNDKDYVKTLLDREPFIKHKVRDYVLKTWEIREGTLPITLSFTETNFSVR